MANQLTMAQINAILTLHESEHSNREIARLLGVDAAADGSTIVMHSMRQIHRLAATWQLLVDPVTLGFYVGGVTMFGVLVWARLPYGARWKTWIGALRWLTLICVVWAPIRAGVLSMARLRRVISQASGA